MDDEHNAASTLHDHTYGITSDPLTQFAVSCDNHDGDALAYLLLVSHLALCLCHPLPFSFSKSVDTNKQVILSAVMHDADHQGVPNFVLVSESDEVAEKYKGNPVPVDASPQERLLENLAGRRKLCVYDEELQHTPILHFQCNHKQHMRLLVHFYAFMFFEVRAME